MWIFYQWYTDTWLYVIQWMSFNTALNSLFIMYTSYLRKVDCKFNSFLKNNFVNPFQPCFASEELMDQYTNWKYNHNGYIWYFSMIWGSMQSACNCIEFKTSRAREVYIFEIFLIRWNCEHESVYTHILCKIWTTVMIFNLLAIWSY